MKKPKIDVPLEAAVDALKNICANESTSSADRVAAAATLIQYYKDRHCGYVS